MIKLYNEDYRKVKLNKKVDLILVDIPYNIGKDAYASNVRWWKDGFYKKGKSILANSKFFDKEVNFNIEDMLYYISLNLKEDCKAVIFCSYEQQFDIISKMKKYKFKKYTPLVFVKNNSAEVLKSNMRILCSC